MDSGLLSLKWNNHGSNFTKALSRIRKKDHYSDATLACYGTFFPVHKFVLSTCSDYFKQIFDKTTGKHPVIVLHNIEPSLVEHLLNYMYLGEVSVLQSDVNSLVNAAETLRIKGLAVPDGEPESDDYSTIRKVKGGGGILPDGETEGTRKEVRSMERNVNSENRRVTRSFERSASMEHVPKRRRKDTNTVCKDGITQRESRGDSNEVARQMDKDEGFVDPVIPVKIEVQSPKREVEDDSCEGEDCLSNSAQCLVAVTQQTPSRSTAPGPSSTSRSGRGSFTHCDDSAVDYDILALSHSDDCNQDSNLAARALGLEPMEVDVQCPQCLFMVRSSLLEFHIEHHQNGRYACTECDYTSGRRDRFEVHLKSHTSTSCHGCPYCPYKSTSKAAVHRHMKIHEPAKRFTCPHCRYKTSDTSNFKRHMTLTHSTPVLENIE